MTAEPINLPVCGDGTCVPTYRQLDYWTRRGWLAADERRKAGSGHPRHWSDAELRVAEQIASLRSAGFELPTAARVARQLCEEGRAELAPGMVLLATEPGTGEAEGSHAA